MNAQFQVAQATGTAVPTTSTPVRTFSLAKPLTDQAVVVHLGYDQKVKLDFSSIANEKITLVHVGEKLIILFDNKSTITVDPVFDSRHDNQQLLSIELAPGRDVSVQEFASLFPITTDQSVLPAAGDGSGNAQGSGANFSSSAVDPLNAGNPLDLLGQEELGNSGTGDQQFPAISSPTVSVTGSIELVVDESFIPANGTNSAGSTTGASGSNVDTQNLQVVFTVSTPLGLQSLTYALHVDKTSTGLIDSLSGQGVVLVQKGTAEVDGVVTVNGKELTVFTLTVDGTGHITMTDLRGVHQDSKDNPADTSEGIHLGPGLVSVTATAVDVSGNSATGSFDLGPHITINDDGPSIAVAQGEGEGDGPHLPFLPALEVDESALPSGAQPHSLSTTATQDFSGAFTHVDGADGATITYALSVTAGGVDTHLLDSLTGHEVFLFNEKGTIVAREGTDATAAAGGHIVFTLEVDSSGQVTMTLERSVHEFTPQVNANSDEPISLSNVPVTLTATITDNDGDTASASISIGSTIVIHDDSPTIAVVLGQGGDEGPQLPVLPVLEVDESALPSGAQTPSYPASVTKDFSGLFTHADGADGATISYAVSVSGGGVDTHLLDSLTGHEVFLFNENGTVVARVGTDLATSDPDGAIAFTLKVDSLSGQVTMTLDRSVHELTPQANVPSNEPIQLSGVPVTLTATITDNDGDSASASIDIGSTIVIHDDSPTLTLTPGKNSVTIDETPGQQAGTNDVQFTDLSAAAQTAFNNVANKGFDPDVSHDHNAIGYAVNSGLVSADINFGADGGDATQSKLFELTLAKSGVDSGLQTTAGREIYLFLENGVIVGRYDAPHDGNTVVDGSDPAAFAITIDPTTGQVSVAQYVSLNQPDHATAADGFNSYNEGVSLATGSVSIALTVKDADGDTVTKSVDVSHEITFLDDGPKVTVNVDERFSVVLDETPGVQFEDDDTTASFVRHLFDSVVNTGNDPDLTSSEKDHGAIGFAIGGHDALDVHAIFGADGPAAHNAVVYSLTLNGVSGSVDSGIQTTDGKEIYLTIENGVIVGRVDTNGDHQVSTSDPAAFAIAIDDDGHVATAEYLSLKHPDPHASDETVQLTQGVVSATVTITDGDQDQATASTDISSHIKFEDDVPHAYDVKPFTILDDEAQSLFPPNFGGSGDAFPSLNTLTGGAHSLFNSGADGTESVTFAPPSDIKAIYKLDSGLAGQETLDYTTTTSGGHTVLTATGHVSGNVVFTLDVAGDGSYTFKVSEPLVHPTNSTTEENLSVKIGFTVTDGDGDQDSGSLTVKVNDDTPTVDVDRAEDSHGHDVTLALLTLDESIGVTPGDPNATSDDVPGVTAPSFLTSTDPTKAIGITKTPTSDEKGTSVAELFTTDVDFGADGAKAAPTVSYTFTLKDDHGSTVSNGSATGVETNLIVTALADSPLAGLTDAQRTIYLFKEADGSIVGKIGIGGGGNVTDFVALHVVIDQSSGEPRIVVEQYLPIQHSNTNSSDESASLTFNDRDASLGVTLTVTATDGDGDVASDSKTVTLAGHDSSLIKIEDSGPTVTITATGVTVVHDETPGVQNAGDPNPSDDVAGANLPSTVLASFNAITNQGSDPDVPNKDNGAIGFALSSAAVVSVAATFGTDGPAKTNSTVLSLQIDGGNNTDSGLQTTDGQHILLRLETYNGVSMIVGRVDGNGDHSVSTSDPAAFAIEIGQDGRISVAQYLSLKNPSPGSSPSDLDEPTTTLQHVQAVVTVTDGDGDHATQAIDISSKIQFQDDGPTLTVTAPAVINGLDFGAFVLNSNEWGQGSGTATGTNGGWTISDANSGHSGADLIANTGGGTVQLERVGDGYLGMHSSTGGYMVDLDASPHDVKISQVVTGLASGQTYDLRFEAGAPFPNLAHLEVWFGGVKVGDISPTGQMQEYTIQVVGGSGPNHDNLLEFRETGTPDNQGTYLANVSVGEIVIDETAGIQADSNEVAANSLFNAVAHQGFDPDMQPQFAEGRGAIVSVSANFGSDGPATSGATTYVVQTANSGLTDSGLQTTAGQHIILFNETYNGVSYVVGRYDSNGDHQVTSADDAAFAFTVNASTGKLSLVQYVSLHEPNTASNDEGVFLNTGSLSVTVTVKDGDNDTASKTVDVSAAIRFDDDGPTAALAVTKATLTIDETAGQDAGTNDVAHLSDFTGLFSSIAGTPIEIAQSSAAVVSATATVYGADGQGAAPVFVLNVSASGVDSGLDATDGRSVFLFKEGNLIVGREGLADGTVDSGGKVAFAISIDSATGVLTVAEYTALYHHNPADPNEAASPLAIADNAIQASVTVTDGDGDTSVASVGIGGQIHFLDDGPTVAAAPLSQIVNGNFSQGVWSDPAWWGSMSTDVTGWTISQSPVGPGTVDLERTPSGYLGMTTSNGADMVDMGSSPGNIEITQSFTNLTPGQSYAIQFEAGAPFPETAKLQVVWDGQVIGTIDPSGPGQLTSYNYIVTATGHDTLSFVEIGTGNAPITQTWQGHDLASEDYHGTYLANVGLVATYVVDEDGLPAGNHDLPTPSEGDAAGIATSVTGALGINWGADNYDPSNDTIRPDGSFAQDNDGSALTGRNVTFTDATVDVSGIAGHVLTSNGQTVQYMLTGMGATLIGYVGDPNHKVFEVSLSDDGTGAFKFTLLGQLDHAPNGSENDIDLTFHFTATDSDGDSAHGTFMVGVDDDVPVVTAAGDTVNVNEANLPDDRHLSPVALPGGGFSGEAQAATGFFHINWGADNGDAKHLAFAKDAQGNVLGPQLTSDGVQLDYVVRFPSDSPGNEQIIAYKHGGNPDTDPVFSITLYEQGHGYFTYVQYQNIDHPGAGADVDVLNFNVIATDADGDSVQTSLTVKVVDDIPLVIASGSVTGEVDEDGLPTGNIDAGRLGETAGTGHASISGDAGSLKALVSFGADGPGAHPFQLVDQTTASAWISGLHLTSQGQAIDHATVSGNTVTAQSHDGRNIFSLTVNDDGSWTFALKDQLDHPKQDDPSTPTQEKEFEDTLSISLGGLINAVDGDGDVTSLGSANFTVTVRDDEPYFGTISTGSVTQLHTAATGTFDFHVGADEPGHLTVAAPAISGVDVATVVDGNGITTVTGTFHGSGLTYYVLTVNPNGTYSFEIDNLPTGTAPLNPVDLTSAFSPVHSKDFGPFTITADTNQKLNGSGQGVGIDSNNAGDGGYAKITFDNEMTVANLHFKSGGSSDVTITWIATDTHTGQHESGQFTIPAHENGTDGFTVDPSIASFDQLELTTSTDGSGKIKIKDIGGTEVTQNTNVGPFDFTLTGTDADNDAATGTIHINANIGVNGIPTISSSDAAELSDAAGNDHAAGPTPDPFVAQSATGSLHIDYGHDGPGTPEFAAVYDGGLGAVVSQTSAGGVTTITTASWTLTINETTGDYTFKQTAAYHHDAGADTDSGHVTVTVKDGNGDTATGTLTLTIDDDVPTAHADVNSAESGALITGNVENNDVGGADGIASIAWNNVSLNHTVTGAHGVLTVGTDGAYSYHANPNTATGADQFTYTITDGDGDTSTTTLTINVTNGQPTVAPATVTVDEAALDTTKDSGDLASSAFTGSNPTLTTESATGTLSFSDPDGVTVTGVAAGTSGSDVSGHVGTLVQGTYGVLEINSSGHYTYTLTKPVTEPSANNGADTVNGADVFTYTVTDSFGNTSTSTVSINIKDDVPTAHADVNSAESGALITGNVENNDVGGADGIASIAWNNVSLNHTVAGAHGVLTVGTDGSYSYHANPNAATGADQFTYTITDGDGDTSTTTLTINVTNGQPTVAPATVTVDEAALDTTKDSGDLASSAFTGSNPTLTTESATGTVSFSDPDGVTVTGVAAGTSGSDVSGHVGTLVQGTYGVLEINSSGHYTYTLTKPVTEPSANNGADTVNGADVFTYTVTDSLGNTSTSTVSINVKDDVPIARGETANVAEASATNVVFMIDTSGSTDGTTLASEKQAAINLLNAGINGGQVLVVDFNDTAQVSGWMTVSNAITYINGLQADGGTNYHVALTTTESYISTHTTPDAGQTIGYFLSDGEPTEPFYNPDISNSEQVTWDSFLATNHISTVYGVNVASTSADSDIAPIAYPTPGDNIGIGSNANGLLNTIPATVHTASGNVLSNDTFGADGPGVGAGILSITVGPATYTFDGTNFSDGHGHTTLGSVLTAVTSLGTLTFNFATGAYSYATSASVNADQTETFHYTLVDHDGDQAGADLSIVIKNSPHAPTGLDLDALDDTGTSSSDNITNHTTGLTITGAAENGTTVTLYDDTNNDGIHESGEATLGSAAVSGGTFSIDVSLLTDGLHHVRGFETDASNNVSPSSSSLDITIDTAAPAAAVTGIVNDSGVVGDHITNDNRLIIEGTAEAGTTVIVYRNGTSIGTIVADGNGDWSLDDTGTKLSDGTYQYTARATDVAGNSTLSSGYAVTVDTTKPTESVHITAISQDTGVSSTDFVTNDTQLTVSGTNSTLATGDKVQVSTDGFTWFDATQTDSTHWSYSDPATHSSDFTYYARVVDAAGNVGNNTDQQDVDIDITPPTTTVAISGIQNDTGASSSDFITSDRTLTLNGTYSNLGSNIIQVSTDNGQTWNNADTSFGSWSYTDPATHADGTFTYQVRVIDIAGNVGNTAAHNVTVDGTAPGAPSTPDMTAATDSGSSNTDNVTNDQTPTFTGTAEAGSTVNIYSDGNLVGTGVATGGTYTITTSSLSDGQHTITAKATDAAGNQSSASGGLTVTIDHVIATPSTPDLIAASDSGSSSTDNITSVHTPTFTGTAETGSTVSIFSDGTLVGTGVATGGTYSIVTSSLADGTHVITAKATDVAGNVSSASAGLSVTIDDSAAAPTLALHSDTGLSSSDRITSSGQVDVSGLETGASWQYSTNNGTSWNNGSGSSFTLTGDGAKTVLVHQTDVAGNTSSNATLNFTLDTVGPTIAITTASHNLNLVAGTVSDSGSGAVSVSVAKGGTSLGTDNSVSSGNWSITSSNFNSGQTITATATDLAGNTASTSVKAVAPAGVSGEAINLALASTAAAQHVGPVSLTIAGVLDGWTLSEGSRNADGTWTVLTNDIGSLSVTSPDGFTGALVFNVMESWTDADGSIGTAYVVDNVEAYAKGSPIFAWSGDDTLTASSGHDMLVFANRIGADVVHGFDVAHDKIDLIGFDGVSSFADVQAHLSTDAAGNAVITLGDGETITLAGVDAKTLTGDDFVFNETPVTHNSGDMVLSDGAMLPLSGIVDNTGRIELGSTGTQTELEIVQHGATLQGGGTVVLSDNSENVIFGSQADVTLTNVDNTIMGAGQIGDGQLTLVNEGTIVATGVNALVIDTGANVVTNSGTLEAVGSGGMIVHAAIDNEGLLWANGGDLSVTGNVSGNGSALISGHGSLELAGAFSGEVKFDDNASGTLVLDHASDFHGVLSGFDANDTLDLEGILGGSASMSYQENAQGNGGVLTVTDGKTTANIAFAGEHTASDFHVDTSGTANQVLVHLETQAQAQAQVMVHAA
ncbi:DUF5801 repeats-in-toxin domain-containing protein [Bradyrhizobium neotropicale]|uniref:VWFA domain-containing protein n=1 Tax=Bradyrhizobium neotropicale TaxID=1497615 RepID=A0A176ZHP4_9BRAD|nr:DUF5801 repeats-in-toxin domain-containing protein [Bradyrhizobium neotropicale]OAF19403.1 hypothetical protein AXW67_37130 [Bradyrhizobium neotropicale]